MEDLVQLISTHATNAWKAGVVVMHGLAADAQMVGQRISADFVVDWAKTDPENWAFLWEAGFALALVCCMLHAVLSSRLRALLVAWVYVIAAELVLVNEKSTAYAPGRFVASFRGVPLYALVFRVCIVYLADTVARLGYAARLWSSAGVSAGLGALFAAPVDLAAVLFGFVSYPLAFRAAWETWADWPFIVTTLYWAALCSGFTFATHALDRVWPMPRLILVPLHIVVHCATAVVAFVIACLQATNAQQLLAMAGASDCVALAAFACFALVFVASLAAKAERTTR
jgi:hypothetical protein